MGIEQNANDCRHEDEPQHFHHPGFLLERDAAKCQPDEHGYKHFDGREKADNCVVGREQTDCQREYKAENDPDSIRVSANPNLLKRKDQKRRERRSIDQEPGEADVKHPEIIPHRAGQCVTHRVQHEGDREEHKGEMLDTTPREKLVQKNVLKKYYSRGFTGSSVCSAAPALTSRSAIDFRNQQLQIQIWALCLVETPMQNILKIIRG
ncbi:hypothetical protein [Rhizobium sp. RM]|uniref:hypothetical protein n=1 Tax=Rhizobium sp. RM TaxID=2748079 RepID=UPI00110E2C9A|nr:hypothetical protein [Rhizobium sp. RM]NWJ23869.1 hypothetical protein [Rhizobium sp. RM]TMV19685.1 hypothetical protein BJG94_14025 [Rhizobium sp. Td3]